MPPAPKTVLWVDDEAELLESHRLFLTEKGFEVSMASNAADALELLRRRAFDLMLRDALGVDVTEYLVKPVNPRQVLSVVLRILEGPKIRQQAIARSFVERFR